MSTSRAMKPLSVVLNQVMKKGYKNELRIGEDGAWFREGGKKYKPKDLLIEKVYRFEGESDPADMSILYIISARDGESGYLLNAYGTYSAQDNPYYDQFIIDIPVSSERKDRHRIPDRIAQWVSNTPFMRKMIIIQGGYYILMGVWSIIDIESFMWLTGAKTDIWMMYTIGGLLLAIGLSLINLSRFKQIRMLQGLSALTLLSTDFIYAAAGILPKVYVIDGIIEIIFFSCAVVSIWYNPSRGNKNTI